MKWTTAIVLLIWQAGKLWCLMEKRRFRHRQIEFEKLREAFWDRHEENMAAIRKGLPEPYPNNSCKG